MAQDKDLIERLTQAVAQVQRELTDCNATNVRLHDDFHRPKPGEAEGAGMCRTEHPYPGKLDCAIPAMELARLNDELTRAQQGKPPFPPGLSSGGRDLVRRIEDRSDAAGLLAKTILFGTALSAFETLGVSSVATKGHDLVDAAEAIGTIPVIERGRTRDEIILYMSNPKNLSQAEQRYWNHALKDLGVPNP